MIRDGVVELYKGVVYWKPPEEALEKVQKLVFEPSISRYGGDDGLPELRAALIKKVNRNNLDSIFFLPHVNVS